MDARPAAPRHVGSAGHRAIACASSNANDMVAVYPELEALWNAARGEGRIFDPNEFTHLSEGVQRYLAHAVAPGTPLACAVRLRMHGTIKLRRWHPFRAEQVIVRDVGMIWNATVQMLGTTIQGYDRLIGNAGAMSWTIFGAIPLLRASGRDISRSAAGRVAAESVWLPSRFCNADVAWSVDDSALTHAGFSVAGYPADLAFRLNHGFVQAIGMRRWGNPGGGRFREVAFGAIVEREETFGGYTIPARLRIGWHFGSPRFETEGHFLRATIDDAVYR